MWPLQISRRSRSYGGDLPQTVLPQEHSDGLASKERNVWCEYGYEGLGHANRLYCRLTALFLATKTTNHPIALDSYTSRIPKTAPSDVLDLEFLVAQSLGFDFAVWHAHRALWGLWLDIQVCRIASRNPPG